VDTHRKSATGLAGMVAKMIGVGGLQVILNRDPAEGWRPTVVKAPRACVRDVPRAQLHPIPPEQSWGRSALVSA
jgi:hypothetical protein